MDLHRRVSGLFPIACLSLGITACATARTEPPPPPRQDPPTTPCDMKARDNVVEVGANGVCKLVTVSKMANQGKGNTILWRAADPLKTVRIELDDPIFPTLSCPGSDHVCQSGDLNAGAMGNDHYVYFYRAWICDAGAKNCQEVVDPGIIIRP